MYLLMLCVRTESNWRTAWNRIIDKLAVAFLVKNILTFMEPNGLPYSQTSALIHVLNLTLTFNSLYLEDPL